MTILQLKYVVAVSTSTSMREASGKLFVSQPALSATIRDLEEEIGIRIFERTNKGIKLTEEGNEFLGFAKQAVSQYEFPFIKGVAALAAYDIGAAFRYKMEKDLFLMIETEGQCLKMNSAGEVYENALINQQELSVLNRYEELVKHNVLLVEAAYDTVAPPDKMLKPLAIKLEEKNAEISYKTIRSNHSFVGQRMKLTNIVGEWMEEVIAGGIVKDFNQKAAPQRGL